MADDGVLKHAVSGCAAAVGSMAMLYPLDQMRLIQQVRGVDTRQFLEEIYNDKTARNKLYAGLVPVCASLAASSFVYFYAHHYIKSFFHRTFGTSRLSATDLLIVSSIAGVINVLTTTPLWVGSTRLKLQDKTKSADDGVSALFDQLKSIYCHEGITGLWAGTGASLLLVSNPIIQFVCYELARQSLLSTDSRNDQKLIQRQSTLSPLTAFLLGALSKAIATILTYPLQVAQSVQRAQEKKQQQEQQEQEGKGEVMHEPLTLFKCFSQLYEKDGVKGLFRGLDTKLVQTALTSAFMFLFYEIFLDKINGWLERQKAVKTH